MSNLRLATVMVVAMCTVGWCTGAFQASAAATPAAKEAELKQVRNRIDAIRRSIQAEAERRDALAGQVKEAELKIQSARERRREGADDDRPRHGVRQVIAQPERRADKAPSRRQRPARSRRLGPLPTPTETPLQRNFPGWLNKLLRQIWDSKHLTQRPPQTHSSMKLLNKLLTFSVLNTAKF